MVSLVALLLKPSIEMIENDKFELVIPEKQDLTSYSACM